MSACSDDVSQPSPGYITAYIPLSYHSIVTIRIIIIQFSIGWESKRKKLSRHDTHQLDKSHNEIGERLNLIRINFSKKKQEQHHSLKLAIPRILFFLQGEMKRTERKKNELKIEFHHEKVTQNARDCNRIGFFYITAALSLSSFSFFWFKLLRLTFHR